ncbi:ankyrin repeat domain-containing protein 7-like [Onychomys torridus]|uniref:ankyrin repeat domain-containing protein 7-like n=1 Tax=Onychomys torridus TaxID=38674 RepID=UPI00167FD802|nr:ankyrin repeat domain-containing protein 7-like [Onychomys torridus]
MVALLLPKKASIDVQDDEGCTPLMKVAIGQQFGYELVSRPPRPATQSDNEECVTLLLIQGANPHLRDLNGNTALHHAVFRDNTTIARKLLDYNADMEAKTKFGLTPYELALFEGKHQMAQFLMQYGTNAHSEAESNRLSEKPNGPTCIPEERDTSCITKKSEKQFSYSSNICTLKKMKTEINLSSLGKKVLGDLCERVLGFPNSHVEKHCLHGNVTVNETMETNI